MNRPRVTVVIPIHNEAGYLPEAMPRLLAELEDVAADIDILLVENGSTDSTADVAAGFAARHPHVATLRLPEPDYGAAMRAGFLTARGDWVVNFDIDFFSGSFLNSVLRAGPDADVVLASKRVAGSADHRPLLRRLGTRVFNLLLTILFRSRVSDTHGMKAIRAHVVADVTPRVISTLDLFDTELVLRAERAGYRIVETPVQVIELRTTGMGLLRRVPRVLAGLWTLRRRFAREGRSARRGDAV